MTQCPVCQKEIPEGVTSCPLEIVHRPRQAAGYLRRVGEARRVHRKTIAEGRHGCRQGLDSSSSLCGMVQAAERVPGPGGTPDLRQRVCAAASFAVLARRAGPQLFCRSQGVPPEGDRAHGRFNLVPLNLR